MSEEGIESDLISLGGTSSFRRKMELVHPYLSTTLDMVGTCKYLIHAFCTSGVYGGYKTGWKTYRPTLNRLSLNGSRNQTAGSRS